jgi:L-ascorbate metabolism protein UlaG (beta-lactamase superfamily)
VLNYPLEEDTVIDRIHWLGHASFRINGPPHNDGTVVYIDPWRGGITVKDVFVRAVPAYTLNKAYHAREFGGLGFLISIMKYDIYFAGDTDLIPEMEKIGCDIALLPVGGVFTMNSAEAAEAARCMRPRYAVPMHFGVEVPGSKDDGRRFCQLVNGGTEAVMLPIENQKLRI